MSDVKQSQALWDDLGESRGTYPEEQSPAGKEEEISSALVKRAD